LPQSLPSRGTYALVIGLRRSTTVRVGALGRLFFKKGVYVYVGSARRGLRPRIRRHIAKRKRVRWHIDWITSRRVFEVREVWVSEALGAECDLAAALSKQADGFVPHFGSSDCRCMSHLLYFIDGKAEKALHGLKLLRLI
jgi:sugar fermentation stimulation protein A